MTHQVLQRYAMCLLDSIISLYSELKLFLIKGKT